MYAGVGAAYHTRREKKLIPMVSISNMFRVDELLWLGVGVDNHFAQKNETYAMLRFHLDIYSLSKRKPRFY